MKVFQVSEFIEFINSLVGAEACVVEGEVSGFGVSQNKWVFFDLKDENAEAKIGCFTTVFKLKVPLEDGMRIRVAGAAKIYAKSGQFRINVEAVELVGEGALKRAYELLLKRLSAEGLFAPERKRRIPRFPEVIGVIASRESAAYGDFLRILDNRWKGVKIELAHVQVQGAEAVPDILNAFKFFNSAKDKPDVLVLIRGGGSLEDLQAFNSEDVARAVFSSKIPVIVGVGHERDESIADFVADLRASTPSNAAELAVPDRRDIVYAVLSMASSIEKAFKNEIGVKHGRLTEFAGLLQRYIKEKIAQVDHFLGVIKNLDPRKILKRGYALVRARRGTIIRDIAQVDVGEIVDVQLAKGILKGKIIGKTYGQR